MKPGDVVTIYHDPITQQEVEGKAQLIKKQRELGDGLEYWEVCFDDLDGISKVHRTIKP